MLYVICCSQEFNYYVYSHILFFLGQHYLLVVKRDNNVSQREITKKKMVQDGLKIEG